MHASMYDCESATGAVRGRTRAERHSAGRRVRRTFTTPEHLLPAGRQTQFPSHFSPGRRPAGIFCSFILSFHSLSILVCVFGPEN